jgi:hypothetical protein
MAQPPQIEQADVDLLQLDPDNPRLRRAHSDKLLDQDELLKEMVSWELDELIVSYLKSGFWQHEPLIVVRENRPGLTGEVVVEGNRRTAALKCLRRYLRGEPLPSRRITRIIEEGLQDRPGLTDQDPLFSNVPFVRYAGREEVDAYLGFRHVTGVKQWEPQEKASFIAHLIDGRGYSYEATAKLIGSKPETIRRNYIAFHLLNTFENLIETDQAAEALERARDDFSVFFLSLREEGIRQYLGISLNMVPEEVQEGIANLNRDKVERFLVWLFGSDETDAFIGESRNVKKFAEILSTPEAVEYITERKTPSFDLAYSLTKGASDDVVAALRESREMLRNVLADLDLKKADPEVAKAAWPVISAAVEIAVRLGGDTLEQLDLAVSNARRP